MYTKEESISVQIYTLLFKHLLKQPVVMRNGDPGCITVLCINIFLSPFVQTYLVRVPEAIKLLSFFKAFFNDETCIFWGYCLSILITIYKKNLIASMDKQIT